MEARLRVLLVSGAGERGGAETVLLALLRHLDRREVDPLVACLQNGPFADECAALAPTVTIPAGRIRDLRRGAAAVGELARLVDTAGVDLVHCHGTMAYLYGGRAARRRGVPSVCHLHDVPTAGWNAQRLVETLAFHPVPDAALAVSAYVAERAPARWRDRVRVVPNGVEVDPPPAAERDAWRGQVRGRFGWPAGCPLVVWCGRLQWWKGPHVLLEAAALVNRERPEVRFLLLGGTRLGLEPGYARDLERLRDRLGLERAVAFAGWQPATRPFLAAADLVVHSSVRPEPFGLVVAEAMAAGTGVAADAGGPREIVVDGETGVLVPPGDARALARAIVDLLDDPGRRARLAAGGRARIAASFTAARMARSVEAIYREIAGGRA